MTKEVHGLAGSIRGSQDSDTFDLAGKTAQTIENVIRDAFEDPFDVTGLRLTFVTGAGKLARQKYDESAAKTVTSTLKELGYEESQSGEHGTFKLQHDTGKNLKTVIVFPRLIAGLTDRMGTLNIGDEEPKEQPLIDLSSPEYKMIHTSINTFQRMIESQCPSWSQKKGCVAAIDELKATVEGLDTKLLQGIFLTDAEQELYDSVSMQSLEKKQAVVRELMHKQVDAGQLTSQEKAILLDQVLERIETIDKELKTAGTEVVKKLEAAKKKGLERQKKLESIHVSSPHPLKHLVEINKLRKELVPLVEIERNTKGRLMTLKESQAMARKEEIEQEILSLEAASRGWFESDEMFQIRCQVTRSSFADSQSKKSTTSSSTMSSTNKGATSLPKWVVPGAGKKTLASKTTSKSKAKRGGDSVFSQAAHLMDSDSD